jgi:hypothetical protein
MMIDRNEITQLSCPFCERPLDEASKDWVSVLTSDTPSGAVDYVRPEAWQILSCGHRVEAIIDKSNPDAPIVRLRGAA